MIRKISNDPITKIILNHIYKKYFPQPKTNSVKNNKVLMSAAAALAIEAAALVKTSSKTEKKDN